jgi:Ca2+-transporting ATPase
MRIENQQRLRLYGPNELTSEAPVSRWRKFLPQFVDTFVILLIVATAVSAGLWLHEGDPALVYEAIAIFAIVLLNAVIGYIQEARAEHALVALRQLSAAMQR